METNDNLISLIIGISTGITALGGLINGFMPILVEKYKTRIKNKVKSDEFDTTLEKSKEVRSHMKKILELANIDRVTLWSLSNGETIFENTHLWSLNFYDEVSIGSVLSTQPLLSTQHLNLSYFSDIISDLKDKPVVLFTDANGLENRVVRELTTGTGTKSMYMTIVRNIHGTPMALLMSESVHNYIKRTTKEDVRLIDDIASRLSTLL